MREETINSTGPKLEASSNTEPRPLDIWDNTPEEEQCEIKAFMEAAWADMEASLPPYDWGYDPPQGH